MYTIVASTSSSFSLVEDEAREFYCEATAPFWGEPVGGWSAFLDRIAEQEFQDWERERLRNRRIARRARRRLRRRLLKWLPKRLLR